MAFLIENEKSEHRHWILHIRISLSIKFHLKLTILFFWAKFDQKGYLWSKTKRVNIIIEFCISELVQIPSFALNWQFWQFRPNLPKKGIYDWKRNKWTPALNSAYSNRSNYQDSPETDNFKFLVQIFPKRVFPDENKKSEQHHWILHIRIRLATKFQATTTGFEPTTIWPVWLNGWVFVYELGGCGLESYCSHLNFRFRACFEQWVPWHSGNYRVWVHSEQRRWNDKNKQTTKFQLKMIILIFWTKFAQKGYFRSKTKKVNNIIGFCIFELG